jgi:hypothetical protein
MSLKNPVTQPGIDHGNIRLVAQRLNHKINASLNKFGYNFINSQIRKLSTHSKFWFVTLKTELFKNSLFLHQH